MDVNAETKSYLTPLAIAIASGSIETAQLLASKGGLTVIPRPIEGFRSVLDLDSVQKYPWIDSENQPEDYTIARPVRVVDDLAKELRREAYLGQF